MIIGDRQRLEHMKKHCEEIAGTIVRFGQTYEILRRISIISSLWQ